MDHKSVLLRSWMFVPGDRQKMIDKAVALPVDAILLDIEDGVAPAAKETARKQIAESLDRIAVQKKENPSYRTPARYVRINAVGHERMNADVEYVIRPALEGLAVPKVETPDQVNVVEKILDEREPKMGMVRGSVRLLLALESPRGLFNAYAIATSSPRVIGLMFGAE
ncbi:MAG: CoA ester lyase, partial [Acidobacteria bacterium]